MEYSLPPPALVPVLFSKVAFFHGEDLLLEDRPGVCSRERARHVTPRSVGFRAASQDDSIQALMVLQARFSR